MFMGKQIWPQNFHTQGRLLCNGMDEAQNSACVEWMKLLFSLQLRGQIGYILSMDKDCGKATAHAFIWSYRY